ncbi:hypothetical protein [Paenibacillus tritici]|nr:hypothetical protein [Paenibacillus tritici]
MDTDEWTILDVPGTQRPEVQMFSAVTMKLQVQLLSASYKVGLISSID